MPSGHNQPHLKPMNWGNFKKLINSPRNLFLFSDSLDIKGRLKLFDIYGYALLLKEDKYDYPDNTMLKAIYLDNVEPISNESPVKTSTLDRVLLALYYHYDFNIPSFRQVYEVQKDLPKLLSQIMTRETYRFKKKDSAHKKRTFPKYLHLDLNNYIPTPKFTRLMDYIPMPCAISSPVEELRIIYNAEAGNSITGTIIVDENNKVHDIISIGDVFLDNEPYGNRMRFLHKFKDYNVCDQLVAYNFKQIFQIASTIDSPYDVIIKPMGLNYLDSVWTKYNKDSVYASYISKNEKKTYNIERQSNMGAYLVTLDGRILGSTELIPHATEHTVDKWSAIT